jgi:hypothetical protein
MTHIKSPAKKRTPRSRKSYLTKRRLVTAARAGIQKAAVDTMKVMGYTIVAYKGWVVKKFADGTIQKLEPLVKEETRFRID